MVHGYTQGEPDSERYSPPEVVVAARETLGNIDLDPASTKLVNGMFIRAKTIYTKTENGLDREKCPWKGRVYINPPGAGFGGKTEFTPEHFWNRLLVEYHAGHVTSAVYLAFNAEQLRQSQGWAYSMLKFPFCIPSQRLIFWREKDGRIQPREAGEFMNAVVYVGKSPKRFAKAFESIGTVVVP